MSLENVISEIMKKKLEDGSIEKAVEEKMVAAIDSAVADIFRWGDGEKALKAKLKEVMIPVIEAHDFNKLTLKLDTVLTNIINQTTLVDNKAMLEKFQCLMIEPTVREITLSDIFHEYAGYVSEHVDTADLEATYEDGEGSYEYVEAAYDVEYENERYFKSSFDNAKVVFRCDHDKKEELEYTIKLYKSKECKVWGISSLGISETLDIHSLKSLSKFEIFLLKLDRAFVKINIDCDSDATEVVPEETPEWSLN